jgi:glycosyltransferase involved in cell wall biosynthesis
MIDVIIPTYNRAKALTKVIDSYLTQDHLGQIIFVDDCSTDNTAEYAAGLIKEFPGKIIYHRMDHKSTLPNIRNVGVSLAKNDYIFMGEDDVLLPKNHFKILLEKMNEYHADLISGRRINMKTGQSPEDAKQMADKDKNPVFVRIPFEGYHERYIDKASEVYALHSNALIKKQVFEKIQYDPQYGGNAFREETDFYLRVWDAGFSLWLIPDTLSYHLRNTAVNSSGGSRKKRIVYEYQVWKNTWRLFTKNKNIFKQRLGVKSIYWFGFGFYLPDIPML